MKKLLLTCILFSTTLGAQITLEHTYPSAVSVYSGSDGTYYLKITGKNVQILNSNFSVYKQFNVVTSNGLDKSLKFSLTKRIFNNDDKFEVIIFTFSGDRIGDASKMTVFNEDGGVVKDFGGDFYRNVANGAITSLPNTELLDIFVDKKTNRIKFKINGSRGTEIYDLGNSNLGIEEVDEINQTKAFPVPASSILNITNPKNGSSLIEVFDVSGRKVLTKILNTVESSTEIDVSSLSKGTYIYKIGNSTNKFLKN